MLVYHALAYALHRTLLMLCVNSLIRLQFLVVKNDYIGARVVICATSCFSCEFSDEQRFHLFFIYLTAH